jgi:hypothetical protein
LHEVPLANTSRYDSLRGVIAVPIDAVSGSKTAQFQEA